VRAETHRRFLEKFAPCGLRPEAHVVAYGLAENTLAVTHHGRRIVTVNQRLLQRGTLRLETAPLACPPPQQLVSCGKTSGWITVKIVDPETRVALGEKQVGEIWVAGKAPATVTGSARN